MTNSRIKLELIKEINELLRKQIKSELVKEIKEHLRSAKESPEWKISNIFGAKARALMVFGEKAKLLTRKEIKRLC